MFINPERNSYPDIDSDFPQRWLHYVRQLTAEYFGVDNCCGVNAFGNIKNKRAIQDSFRVYGFEAQDYNKVSKEIKNDAKILDSILESDNLKKKYEEDTTFEKAVDIAGRITGNVRQAGTHAAGMIITPRGMDMFRKLPVMITKGRLNSQYDKKDIEYAGFLKMDLLGIRNLDIIQDTLDYIKKYRNIDLNIRAIPLDDARTYELYQTGDTDFVFQVESPGMKDFLRKLHPCNIEDIIVVLAGYRPGPMQYLQDYVQIKNGTKEAVYRHPLVKPILEVTGGISFYQEQIMDLFKSLAGYSLGRADLVRRALGKKNKEILDKEKHNFIYGIPAKDKDGNPLYENGKPVMEVKGCINNGIPEDVANQIYEDILPFANYGFNKSHAAGYAILSYRTAYLKANYFMEYATSVLRSVETHKSKLALYADIVRNNGVKILFPNINKSNVHMDIFDFQNKIISTGLMSVKGLPEQMANNIVEDRNSNGNFTDFDNFLKRMSKYHIDKKSVNSLVCAGAFDDFDKNYSRMLNYYECIGEYYKKIEELHSESQKTIYDIPQFKNMMSYLQSVPDDNGYNLQERLSLLCEHNLVGIHPDVTDSYKDIKFDLRMSRYQRDEEFDSKEGTVTGILEKDFELSKKGKAFITTMRVFNGDIYKLIVSKAKVSDMTDDIFQYKKGMVIDVTGSFRFPKPKIADEDEEDETEIEENGESEENKKEETPDIVVFPKALEIKFLENSFIPTEVILDFDHMNTDKERVMNYFGVSTFKDVLKKLLGNFCNEDEKGKKITVIHDGNSYTSPHFVNISMNEIKKMGCEYRVA